VTDRYAVIGSRWRTASLPFIPRRVCPADHQDLDERILAPLDGFGSRCELSCRRRQRLNVTLPFKLEAFQIATERGPRAQDAAAVNTSSSRAQRLYGENTDGIGW
jgi:shikimate dehydrogenase